MPNKNIYDAVLVICDDANKFRVVIPDTDEDFKVNFHTLAESRDVNTALALKKAYCDGFYDGFKGFYDSRKPHRDEEADQ